MYVMCSRSSVDLKKIILLVSYRKKRVWRTLQHKSAAVSYDKSKLMYVCMCDAHEVPGTWYLTEELIDIVE